MGAIDERLERMNQPFKFKNYFSLNSLGSLAKDFVKSSVRKTYSAGLTNISETLQDIPLMSGVAERLQSKADTYNKPQEIAKELDSTFIKFKKLSKLVNSGRLNDDEKSDIESEIEELRENLLKLRQDQLKAEAKIVRKKKLESNFREQNEISQRLGNVKPPPIPKFNSEDEDFNISVTNKNNIEIESNDNKENKPNLSSASVPSKPIPVVMSNTPEEERIIEVRELKHINSLTDIKETNTINSESIIDKLEHLRKDIIRALSNINGSSGPESMLDSAMDMFDGKKNKPGIKKPNISKPGILNKAKGLTGRFGSKVGGLAKSAGSLAKIGVSGLGTLASGAGSTIASVGSSLAPYALPALAVAGAGAAGYAAGTLINSGINYGMEKLTGGKNKSLGDWIYDKTHDDPKVEANNRMKEIVKPKMSKTAFELVGGDKNFDSDKYISLIKEKKIKTDKDGIIKEVSEIKTVVEPKPVTPAINKTQEVVTNIDNKSNSSTKSNIDNKVTSESNISNLSNIDTETSKLENKSTEVKNITNSAQLSKNLDTQVTKIVKADKERLDNPTIKIPEQKIVPVVIPNNNPSVTPTNPRGGIDIDYGLNLMRSSLT